MRSPTSFLVLCLALIAIFLGGCPDKPNPKDDPVIKQLQEDLAAKNADIGRLNDKLAATQGEVNKWSQIAAWLVAGAVIGVILSLVVGSAMGSRARRDAATFHTPSPPDQDEEVHP